MTILRQDESQGLLVVRGKPGRGFTSLGKTPLFPSYLKINQLCVPFRLELGAFRSDDASRYFTILVVGHIFPAMLLLEQLKHPSVWLHAATWLSFTLALIVLTLPRLRGAVVGVQRGRTPRG
jgi:uncharacterized protein (DUF983 family)